MNKINISGYLQNDDSDVNNDVDNDNFDIESENEIENENENVLKIPRYDDCKNYIACDTLDELKNLIWDSKDYLLNDYGDMHDSAQINIIYRKNKYYFRCFTSCRLFGCETTEISDMDKFPKNDMDDLEAYLHLLFPERLNINTTVSGNGTKYVGVRQEITPRKKNRCTYSTAETIIYFGYITVVVGIWGKLLGFI